MCSLQMHAMTPATCRSDLLPYIAFSCHELCFRRSFKAGDLNPTAEGGG